MHAHPDELKHILTSYPRPGYSHNEYPLVSSFLVICEELESGMVWTDAQQRMEWRTALELLRFQLKRWLSVSLPELHTALKRQHLDELAALAAKVWRGPGPGVVRQLPFVKDAGLRAIAERDYASLAVARKQDEVKTVLVLSGCVVEAVLLDVVVRKGAVATAAAQAVKAVRQAKNPRVWGGGFDASATDRWTFAQLVGVCGDDGLKVLSTRAEAIADTVRDFRNLVHPRLELQETATSPLSLSEAIATAALVDIVLDEVARAPP